MCVIVFGSIQQQRGRYWILRESSEVVENTFECVLGFESVLAVADEAT